jgi:hypothetical protein
MRPADVNLANAEELWERMYGDMYKPKQQAKYEVGDTVRISKEKKAFQKGYLPQFTNEIFKIDAVKTSKDPPNYRIVDQKGEEIVGKFYNEEFSKAVPETLSTYEIEKVIKTRMRAGRPEYLVKFKNHTNPHWVRK